MVIVVRELKLNLEECRLKVSLGYLLRVYPTPHQKIIFRKFNKPGKS